MALKNKTRDHDKVSASRRAPRQTAQTANEYERPVSPAVALKRAAGEHPSALRPTDILALQRAVGNRAVGRLLRNQPDAPAARPSTPAGAVQRKTEEEEQALQGKFGTGERKENITGLPDNLKAGVENLSGVSLDDVKVHYNSSAPAEVQALAYTKGTDIHVGPGQEAHLPHEAWHVVQQKQGRVKPTLQAKGLPINDDRGLEGEADVMGEKAKLTGNVQKKTATDVRAVGAGENRLTSKPPQETVQLLTDEAAAFYYPEDKKPFEANFEKNHVVTDAKFTDQEARSRRANRNLASNTMIKISEAEGETELKKAIKDLKDSDAKSLDDAVAKGSNAPLYEWNTQAAYDYKTAKDDNSVASGNSRHRLGMTVAVKGKKELVGIKIKHWADLA